MIEFTTASEWGDWGALVYRRTRERERDHPSTIVLKAIWKCSFMKKKIGDSLGPIRKERERERWYIAQLALGSVAGDG